MLMFGNPTGSQLIPSLGVDAGCHDQPGSPMPDIDGIISVVVTTVTMAVGIVLEFLRLEEELLDGGADSGPMQIPDGIRDSLARVVFTAQQLVLAEFLRKRVRWDEQTMEDYFRQFLGSQVVSIVQPEDNWSSLLVFQLMKNGVRSSFTLVGDSGSCGARATPRPFLCGKVSETLLNSSPFPRPDDTDGKTIFLIYEWEAEDVRGFFRGRSCYWSALVRISVSSGPNSRKLVFGGNGIESGCVCIGLWPLQQPFMPGSNISLHMQFIRDYLNLLQDLQISAVEYSPPGKLFLRVLRSDCVLTVMEEMFVLDMDETRICASIYDVERSYVDLANLANYLIDGCFSGQLFVESFKTTRLEGDRGRCPGQMVCVCHPLPQIWKASVEITLKWGPRRVKIGQIPLCRNVNVCDIGASGLWPQTVPFFHGVL